MEGEVRSATLVPIIVEPIVEDRPGGVGNDNHWLATAPFFRSFAAHAVCVAIEMPSISWIADADGGSAGGTGSRAIGEYPPSTTFARQCLSTTRNGGCFVAMIIGSLAVIVAALRVQSTRVSVDRHCHQGNHAEYRQSSHMGLPSLRFHGFFCEAESFTTARPQPFEEA